MQSLREAFEAVAEYRVKPKYELASLLTLISLAMLCGCNGGREIARWAKNHRWEFAERLGFAHHRMPSLGTLQRRLGAVEPNGFAAVVGAWGQAVLRACGREEWQGLAIDGKTVHGSKTDELPAVHLLSALSQELKVVLGQVGVDKKTNEIKAMLPLLADLVLDGQVVTVDALLTQRDIAQTIVEKKGIT